jgi:hypothetical protein
VEIYTTQSLDLKVKPWAIIFGVPKITVEKKFKCKKLFFEKK